MEKLTGGLPGACTIWEPVMVHTSYLSFFVRHRIFWPVNCMPEKCVNRLATKQRKSILTVLAVLVGEYAVFGWRTWCLLHLGGVFVT